MKNRLFYVGIVFAACLVVLASSGMADSHQSLFRTEDAHIRVASFNIRVGRFSGGSKTWSNRRDMVISMLAGRKYDVVGLQEALDFQLDEIRQGLPQFKSYAVDRSRDGQDGEMCAVLYRNDRFVMVDSGTLWFSRNPERPGSKFFGTLFPRICSWVRLADVDTARCFYVYNLHLDSLSQRAREKSVRILADLIENRKHPDPFVVMGDFNMELQNPAMMYLQQFDMTTPYPRLQDTWAAVYPFRLNEGTYHRFSGTASGPKIDHILVQESARVLSAAIDRRGIDGCYPSDHFPVSATIDLWPENESSAKRRLAGQSRRAIVQREQASGG